METLTTSQKFDILIKGLSIDLNDAFESATLYEKYSDFTLSIDPENMFLLKAIVKIDCKGHESFNKVAYSIMNLKRKFTEDVKELIVKYYW